MEFKKKFFDFMYKVFQNYPINWEYDAFLNEIIDHKDEVKVALDNKHYLVIFYKNRYYGFWVSNYPYAYLSEMLVLPFAPVKGMNYEFPKDFDSVVKDEMPSPATVRKFKKEIAPPKPKPEEVRKNWKEKFDALRKPAETTDGFEFGRKTVS